MTIHAIQPKYRTVNEFNSAENGKAQKETQQTATHGQEISRCVQGRSMQRHHFMLMEIDKQS